MFSPAVVRPRPIRQATATENHASPTQPASRGRLRPKVSNPMAVSTPPPAITARSGPFDVQRLPRVADTTANLPLGSKADVANEFCPAGGHGPS